MDFLAHTLDLGIIISPDIVSAKIGAWQYEELVVFELQGPRDDRTGVATKTYELLRTCSMMDAEICYATTLVLSKQ
jgi:hypothetical protein